jgi:hypothetical protein
MNAQTEEGVIEFVIDRETGRTVVPDLTDPDPAFVLQMVAEAQRLRKEMAESHKVLLERMFRVSQMWLAGAALMAGAALWQPSRAGWLLALGFGLGFCLALYGQRARKAAPLGVAPHSFNDWLELRTATATNQQALLSTWQQIIEQANDELAWRARWLNIGLASLGAFTVFAMAVHGMSGMFGFGPGAL